MGSKARDLPYSYRSATTDDVDAMNSKNSYADNTKPQTEKSRFDGTKSERNRTDSNFEFRITMDASDYEELVVR